MRLVLLALTALIGGCETRGILHAPELSWERMLEVPRAEPYGASPLFPDGPAMRHPPAGTVPRGAVLGDLELTHGVAAGGYTGRIPVPVTGPLLARGRDRYEIYCAACHGIMGDGRSAVAANMTLRPPPSLVAEPIRGYPPGRVYRTIQQGYGLMPSYAEELPIVDRWAVVTYLEALQINAGVPLAELPPDLRREGEEVLP